MSSRALALARTDLKNISRDPMLLFIAILPLAMGLGARFAVPAATNVVRRWVDLTAYYDFIMGMLLLFVPAMLGRVTGFVLVGERDEDLLTAIAVTPMGRRGFLIYRLTIPVLASFLACFLVVGLAGLAPFHPLRLIPVALLATAQAPLMALILAALARNKVEGVAIAKGASVVLAARLAIVLVESDWQLLAGVLPTCWVVRAYLAESGVAFAIALGGGLLVTAAATLLATRLFDRRVD